MRYLLTIALLLMATSSFAVLTKTYTVCESGCDYTTLQAAETAHEQDLVANDSALTFEIQNTWVSADGGTLVDGSTTDATRFFTITAVGAARASATFSTTAYRAEGAGALIAAQEAYTVIDGLQGEVTTSFDVVFSVLTGGTNTTIRNCFANGGGQSNSIGIRGNDATFTGVHFYNNVVIDCVNIGIQIIAATTGGVKIDNNTIENCGTGISTSTGDTQIRNNIIWNVTTPLVGDFVELSQENYTDAGSVSYGTCSDCGTGDQLSQSDPFVNIGGENYLLAAGATAIDAGQDLSGDFTDAIGGKTRDANFDKGADEFIASGGTTLEGVTLEGVTLE